MRGYSTPGPFCGEGKVSIAHLMRGVICLRYAEFRYLVFQSAHLMRGVMQDADTQTLLDAMFQSSTPRARCDWHHSWSPHS